MDVLEEHIIYCIILWVWNRKHRKIHLRHKFVTALGLMCVALYFLKLLFLNTHRYKVFATRKESWGGKRPQRKIRQYYLFIYWNVFLLASLSIITSRQRNSYFVQFCQQYEKFTEYPPPQKKTTTKNNELSWRSKEKWFEMFLTVSNVQFINLKRSASGIVFHNVGPAWANALFCILLTVLTLGTSSK